MTELQKVFISHHNSDAAALELLKKTLGQHGFQCFLAHKDIRSGNEFREVLKKEVRDRDALVYVCNEKANSSPYCQQEVGMAEALGKKIVAITTDENRPQGFIEGKHAAYYPKIDFGFCEEVYQRLLEIFPLPKEITDHLGVLGINGFSLSSAKNGVKLEKDEKDDSCGCKVSFLIYFDEKHVGEAKIAYRGQNYGQSVYEYLPPFFAHLKSPLSGLSFFSCVYINETLMPDSKQVNSLRHLLNDVAVMSEAKAQNFIHETVYKRCMSREIHFHNI